MKDVVGRNLFACDGVGVEDDFPDVLCQQVAGQAVEDARFGTQQGFSGMDEGLVMAGVEDDGAVVGEHALVVDATIQEIRQPVEVRAVFGRKGENRKGRLPGERIAFGEQFLVGDAVAFVE